MRDFYCPRCQEEYPDCFCTTEQVEEFMEELRSSSAYVSVLTNERDRALQRAEQAEAEAKRLRAALELVVEYTRHSDCSKATGIARAALRGEVGL